jgi:hypothetical protein
MKKLLLLLLVSISTITYAQKFSKVYRASLLVYENNEWVTKKNIYPKSIMVITNGNSVKITNENESSYMTYGEMEKKSYETFDCYSWYAYDKEGKQCEIIIKDFEKEKIKVFMVMYYKDSLGFEYEIEQEK